MFVTSLTVSGCTELVSASINTINNATINDPKLSNISTQSSPATNILTLDSDGCLHTACSVYAASMSCSLCAFTNSCCNVGIYPGLFCFQGCTGSLCFQPYCLVNKHNLQTIGTYCNTLTGTYLLSSFIGKDNYSYSCAGLKICYHCPNQEYYVCPYNTVELVNRYTACPICYYSCRIYGCSCISVKGNYTTIVASCVNCYGNYGCSSFIEVKPGNITFRTGCLSANGSTFTFRDGSLQLLNNVRIIDFDSSNCNHSFLDLVRYLCTEKLISAVAYNCFSKGQEYYDSAIIFGVFWGDIEQAPSMYCCSQISRIEFYRCCKNAAAGSYDYYPVVTICGVGHCFDFRFCIGNGDYYNSCTRRFHLMGLAFSEPGY